MITDMEYDICRTQGNIYELIAKNGYDISLFSGLYLKSDFCRRVFDTGYFGTQFLDELECMDFLIPEIQDRFPEIKSNPVTANGFVIAHYVPIKYFRREPKTCFSPDIAYWIGFTYRQLYVETGTSSRELSEKIPFQTMCRYYTGLLAVDEDAVTDIICENLGLVKIRSFPGEGE